MAERKSPTDGLKPWQAHLMVALCYAGIAWCLVDHGANPNEMVFGTGEDPFIFIWFLEWWPWAIGHHLDPLWSHQMWQPLGVSVLWMTSLPAIALLAAPLTLLAGPVAVYNFVVLLGPFLAAWCMYQFCLRLVDSRLTACLGGYMFGFSTYEIAQCARPNLAFTCLLPCLGWIFLARAQGGLDRPFAVLLIALAAVGQFLVSTEIFATTVLFSAMAWVFAYCFMPTARDILARLLVDALIAAPVATAMLSPLLMEMLAGYPYVHLPDLWPYLFSASPAGFFVPGPNTLVGWRPAYRLVNIFAGDTQEQGSYLGLPLLVILYHYARENWGQERVRALAVTLAVIAVFSLGPHLWMGNMFTRVLLPWAAVMRLPLLDDALPIRFALFVAFVAAIMFVLWLETDLEGTARRKRLGVGLLACAVIWPAPAPHQALPASTFFSTGRARDVLGPDKQLLILPFAFSGPSSFWQVESQFSFTQTGGYLGFPPRAMQHFKAIWQLIAQDPAGIKPADVADFAETTKADYIVAGPGTPHAEIAVIEELHWRERKVDDVTIFDVLPVGGTGG